MSQHQKPYAWWFDVAINARKHSRGKFRDGVERAAALAATEAQSKGRNNAIDAVELTFEQYRDHSPCWNGSIA